MHWREVRDAGTDIVLGNTYHLMLRPGAERIAALGGLQTFTGWNGPMLTDSGGFQVMSLAELRKLSENAVTFRSHIDGAKVELSPERSIEVQRFLGSDIAMQMDECVRLPAEREDIERGMHLSLRWAERSKRAFESAPDGYMLFGIVQGGDIPEMRHINARGLVEIAKPLPVTFHRGFDEAADLRQALEDVIRSGAQRILTSGGAKSALEGSVVLAELIEAAREQIVIVPGAGIKVENIGLIAQRTKAHEFHSGLSSSLPYGSREHKKFEEEVRKLAEQLARISPARSISD